MMLTTVSSQPLVLCLQLRQQTHGSGLHVEEAVERYLSSLCSSSPLTGLLIGQSSGQRDFVVMATRTPQREACSLTPGSQDRLDMEWINEHARQVSRMLPGGLSVLGVFYISDTEAKDTLITLRQLVFAVQKSISRDFLWVSGDDDITERVTLHVNSSTRRSGRGVDRLKGSDLDARQED
ncbi:unnamed protein product [Lota lota]